MRKLWDNKKYNKWKNLGKYSNHSIYNMQLSIYFIIFILFIKEITTFIKIKRRGGKEKSGRATGIVIGINY